MIIKLSQKRQFRECKRTRRELERYGIWAERTLDILKRRWSFKKPGVLLVRPLYSQRREDGNCGRAGYEDGCHFIAINLWYARQFPGWESAFYTVVHEAVHVADKLVNGDWGHGRQFNEMLRYALKPGNIKEIKKRR